MSLSKPMRIAYVLKRYPRYSETFIVNEILAHEEAGMEIDIFSIRASADTHFQNAISRVRAAVTYLPYGNLKAENFWKTIVDTETLLPGLWSKLSAVRDSAPREIYQAIILASQIRQKEIDHLHAHFANQAAAVARMAAEFADIPYTLTAHAKDIFHESVQPDDLRRKFDDAAATITVSEFNVRYLQDHYRPQADRVKLIYNGLCLDRFPYQAPTDRPPTIVAVGRLVEKKGFEHLIDACEILARRGCEFRCQIIGTGELEVELRRRIALRGVGATVELVGPRPQSEVIDHIHKASVFAAPCIVSSQGDREGLPTVLLEAMALGTPCVSTPVTGIPEVLKNERTGLMVPQGNAVALADAMERLLSDSALRQQFAAEARRLIETQFDIRENAAQLRSVFEQAMQSDRTGTTLEVCA